MCVVKVVKSTKNKTQQTLTAVIGSLGFLAISRSRETVVRPAARADCCGQAAVTDAEGSKKLPRSEGFTRDSLIRGRGLADHRSRHTAKITRARRGGPNVHLRDGHCIVSDDVAITILYIARVCCQRCRDVSFSRVFTTRHSFTRRVGSGIGIIGIYGTCRTRACYLSAIERRYYNNISLAPLGLAAMTNPRARLSRRRGVYIRYEKTLDAARSPGNAYIYIL